MKKIGVLTSGGDSPGMNAAIRAVVRSALAKGVSVVGICRGYAGLIERDFTMLDSLAVGNIIQRGGTILKTSRSEKFKTPEGRERAADNLRREKVEGLVVIGGDGSFRGAWELAKEHDIPIVGIPATIDNDIYGTDYTIGFDTAVNTALDAIDRIRDTALSFERIFFIEVMGRLSGFIALEVGISSGAEEVLLPELKTDIDEICRDIREGLRRGKRSYIIIVAEGDEQGGAFTVAEKVKKKIDIDYRVCILGHVQRGGAPTAIDRILASKLGSKAVETLLEGVRGVMVGEVNRELVTTPFPDTWKKKKPIDEELVRLIKVLS
ncbi:MAG: 6-phosphofructokinase [Acidobacteria bacterium]|nr:6-phosphofructokinase [Acidobacteriota bacterium]